MSRMNDEERLVKINKMLLAKKGHAFIYNDKLITLLEELKCFLIQQLNIDNVQYKGRQ
jgi:hypothetical protein